MLRIQDPPTKEKAVEVGQELDELAREGARRMLAQALEESGCYVGIATHDERLVWEAFQIIESLGLPPERYEFQMLLGVDESLRRIIRDAGHRLRVYVPFGVKRYAYSVRRLRENRLLPGTWSETCFS